MWLNNTSNWYFLPHPLRSLCFRRRGTAGLEIMVYLGILVTRKFLGSQKILTELTAMITQKCFAQWYFQECLFIFLWKCHIPLLDRNCSVLYLSLYMWCTENLLLLHDLHLFCCFLAKSQVAESFLPFSMILFCKMAD